MLDLLGRLPLLQYELSSKGLVYWPPISTADQTFLNVLQEMVVIRNLGGAHFYCFSGLPRNWGCPTTTDLFKTVCRFIVSIRQVQ